MKVAPTIHRLLADDGAISTIINGRVFPNFLPAGSRRRRWSSASPGGSVSGPSAAAPGRPPRTVELVLIGREYDTIEELEELVYTRIDSFAQADVAEGEEAVQLVATEPGVDSVEAPEDGSDEPYHLRTLPVRVHVTELRANLHD